MDKVRNKQFELEVIHSSLMSKEGVVEECCPMHAGKLEWRKQIFGNSKG